MYVGGGDDRFSQVLRGCADRVTVAAPGPLDVDDASADLAVMVSALHERADPADDFAEIARVLRPGGLAVIAAASVLHGPGRARYRPAQRRGRHRVSRPRLKRTGSGTIRKR